MSIAEKKSEKIINKSDQRLIDQKACGLFPCERTNANGRCNKIFLTSNGLAAHVNIFEPVSQNNTRTGSNCKFPTLGLVDTSIEFGSDIHRCIGAKSNYRGYLNSDKSFKPVEEAELKPSIPGYDTIKTNNNLGQYRKNIFSSNRLKYSPAQSEFLQRQFNIGVAHPEQRESLKAVYEKMSKERIKSTGRILFNRRQDNIHGIVVDVVRIKQRFSGIKKDQGTTPIHPREAYWRVHSLSKLKEHVGPMEDLPAGKGAKFKLARIMAERDKRNNYPEGFKDGGYVETPFLNENNYGEFMYY